MPAGRGVSRRQLLQTSALGAAGISLAPAFSAGRVVAAPAAQPLPVKPFEFEEAAISELHARLNSGELTSRGLTEAYLTRISEIDDNCTRTHCAARKRPGLNSVIETNPDALSI